MAMQPKNASDIITFTRSTAAWEWDWQGNYSEVAAGVMRIAHDPLTKSTSTTPQTLGTGSYTFEVAYQYPIGKAVRVSADATNWMVGRVTAASPTSVTIWVSAAPTGAGTYSAWTLIVRRGIRVEEQRTNLLTNSVLAGGTSGIVGSTAVAPTGWIFGSSGGSVTYGLAPWGTTSFLTSKATTSDRPFIQRSLPAAANTTYTLSTQVVSASGGIQIFDVIEVAGRPAGSTVTYAVNGLTVSGTDTPALKAMDVVSCTVSIGGTVGTIFLRVGIGSARPTAPTGAIELTMPQFEVGAAPSTPIPTAASQVIRAADVPLVNTLAPWFNAAEGTLVVKFIRDSISPSQTMVALSGVSNSSMTLESGSGSPGPLRLRVNDSSVQQAIPIGAPSSAAGVSIKLAGAYAANYFAASVNGAAPEIDTGGSVPSVTRLEIGQLNGGAKLNGIIEDITYHPRVQDTQQASA